MNVRILSFFAALLACLTGPSLPVRADTLFDLTNSPVQSTPLSSVFTATGSATTITFAGYDVPADEQAAQIFLSLNGTGPNLLGNDWNFNPAPTGSNAFSFAESTNVPGLVSLVLLFLGTTEGSYDAFSQTIATTPGNSYTLSFFYIIDPNHGAFEPNGLRVTAETATTPLPPALPLFGSGVATIVLFRRRRRRRKADTRSLA